MGEPNHRILLLPIPPTVYTSENGSKQERQQEADRLLDEHHRKARARVVAATYAELKQLKPPEAQPIQNPADIFAYNNDNGAPSSEEAAAAAAAAATSASATKETRIDVAALLASLTAPHGEDEDPCMAADERLPPPPVGARVQAAPAEVQLVRTAMEQAQRYERHTRHVRESVRREAERRDKANFAAAVLAAAPKGPRGASAATVDRRNSDAWPGAAAAAAGGGIRGRRDSGRDGELEQPVVETGNSAPKTPKTPKSPSHGTRMDASRDPRRQR